MVEGTDVQHHITKQIGSGERYRVEMSVSQAANTERCWSKAILGNVSSDIGLGVKFMFCQFNTML